MANKYEGRQTIKPAPAKSEKSPKVISFELKVPSFKKSGSPYRRISKAAGVAIACLLIAGAIIAGVKHFQKSPSVYSTNNEIQQTTLPSGEQAAGKVKTQASYEQQKSVVSNMDKIAGIGVTVSRQPLPETFKEQPEQEVEKLAQSFKANKVIEAKGTKAFYGISSEDGSQTVVLTKKGLLIFIRAQKELDKEALTQYLIDFK